MRSIRPLVVATGLVTALTLTATACGPSEDEANAKPSSTASQAAGSDAGDLADIADRLKEHGIDVDKWKNGAWKNWDKDDWLREAKDFVNPVIEGLWKPERIQEAEPPARTMSASDAAADQGVTDPEPEPVEAEAEKTPYHDYAAPVGKIVFDTPEGQAVCSGTIVKDPANPGKSNLVWTAGHCVHAGQEGGWFRNIAFVPAYNDSARSANELNGAASSEVAPYGVFWADWVTTSGEWITQGATTGGAGAPYDYAVLHVTPEDGSGKSLEETVGAALPVSFGTPAVADIDAMGAWGYPAAPPFDGAKMYKCIDKPGRLSISPEQPTMYRIGCTMTGGSSGGGWFAEQEDGKLALVSNTSIGPVTAGWLAGPSLGEGAEAVFTSMSDKFAGRS
ncbi:serine protease [Streptomyces sp. GC420]|uniref:trypsin-like serine peptidase n=1 Tax=Streptomyces sp. GC420 TaxID=2697568 RepID=UPI00141521FA|nr:hypothetical protein [Streptomyces sp. GC420]NBM14134.1 hypothetical protein [Streptomyces sp. GC420]